MTRHVASVREIGRRVADSFGVTWLQLFSESRLRRIAYPRLIAMYLAAQLTPASHRDIAAVFRKERSTVGHALQVVESLKLRDPGMKARIESLEVECRAALPLAVEIEGLVDDVLETLRARLVRAAIKNPRAVIDHLRDVATSLAPLESAVGANLGARH